MDDWFRTGLIAKLMRGLRMRLTLSFAIFFGLVLISLGFVFRQAISVVLHQQNLRVLDQEWNAVRAYLRFHDDELVWAYDPQDPEEAYAVERLRRILLLTDLQGNIIEISNGYSALGQESKELISRVVRSQRPITEMRSDSKGEAYIVRMGVFRDLGHEYFLAIGLHVEETARVPDRIMGIYFSTMPVMLLAIVVLGWFAAGRALNPLGELAAATETVAGGNLGVRLPPLGTDDELDRLIGTFNRMLERLEGNFRQIQQFSIDASHELRTPITAIRGQLEVALFTAQTNDQYRDAIVTALQDVERLGQIVKSLLLLAQAESGQLPLNKEPQDLVAIADEIVTQFRMAAEEHHIKIDLHAPDVLSAQVDKAHFSRMLHNLLSNAVRYSPDGSHVRLGLRSEISHAVITVADNGPGIAASHLPHIFERFYRVRNGEREADKGIGLGLPFVSWIVKAHDGLIEVRSREGKGTEFEIRLPLN